MAETRLRKPISKAALFRAKVAAVAMSVIAFVGTIAGITYYNPGTKSSSQADSAMADMAAAPNQAATVAATGAPGKPGGPANHAYAVPTGARPGHTHAGSAGSRHFAGATRAGYDSPADRNRDTAADRYLTAYGCADRDAAAAGPIAEAAGPARGS